ncbi:GNAT family N-acetyltransferase [Sorangium cellulosum]|uniref:GNAT family N-acetyltransferase n=1 Tax=Sorangium cellulosum TaxID=56 RepID=UPI001F1929FC|nr:GNAT family N-acetyltransferase [Sorangium cellulosum]
MSHLSDAELDALTAGANVFFGRRWLRMLDAVDLTALVRGEVSLRYAVVSEQGVPVALCPFFITRSRSIHPHYSLEKFFFTGWKADLERLNPSSSSWSGLAVAVADVYRRLAWLSGAGADSAVVAASPLSLRGGVLCAQQPAPAAARARRMIVEGLRELAASEQCPLYFYGVAEEDAALREALTEASFQELFLFYDNVIDVPGERLEDYLGQFKSDARRLLKKEMAQARSDGVRFERLSRLGEMGDQLERFYEVTYSQYGKEHFHNPAWFWAALERHVSPEAEAVVAMKGAEPVGFSLLLHKQEELWFYRVGRAETGASTSALYFNLAFYEPMRRAYQLGARRLWLGPGGYETKRRRGARRHAISGFLWIPRRWSRTLLRPYLSLFSRLSRAQVEGDPRNARTGRAR